MISDTLSAFLVTMNANIINFNKAVQADAKLANGFYAVGLSQGNLIIRGYMEQFNSPAVVRALHIHGTLMGVSAFPHCPDSSALCQGLTGLLGSLAYSDLVQGILFQANYFRDPQLVNSTQYRTTSQIAAWNGESEAAFNPAFKSNFLKTTSLTMIKALADTMIDPKDSEWWGSYDVGSFTKLLPMNQTSWYTADTFGLKTMDQGGRLSFNTSVGDHLQFTKAELEAWMLQAGFASL
jgi:palmitoyl-protein thioesterase